MFVGCVEGLIGDGKIENVRQTLLITWRERGTFHLPPREERKR